MKSLLVAIDGSDGADAALRQAIDIAAAEGLHLVVFTVAPRASTYLELSEKTDEITEYARSEHLAGGMAEAREVFADEILAAARKIVGSEREPQTSYISCAGDPADEIVAFATKHSADAIYLGSRGLSRVGGFLLGSVSRRVTAAAPCRVVIVAKR